MDEQINRQFPPLETIKGIYQLVCNYLRIAIGAGKGESYPFDIRKFTTTYKLDYLDVYHSLKFIELNDYLSLSESVYNPTKVKFAINNTTLYNFQIQYDSILKLTTFLTRSFPGIFDEYMDIQEYFIIKKLNINELELEKQLKFLEQHGIIDISWKSDLPTITFTEERLPSSNLWIDDKIYHQRKEAIWKRWNKMKDYVQQNSVCRSLFLINYFGQQVEPCGKCDVCIKRKNTFQTEVAKTMILNLLTEPLLLDEIYTKFDIQFREDINKIIHTLLTEELIIENNGKYQIKK